MSDEEKVEAGKQCMSCRFDINDGDDMGFPRVCDECVEEANDELNGEREQ